MTLANQTVIVVGGGSGIGLGIARAAWKDGAKVVIVGRSQEKLDQAAVAIGDRERIQTSVADATDESQVKTLLESVGSFDHLLCTAVSAAYQPVREFEIDDARRTLDSKLIGPLLLVKHGVDRIRPGGSFTFTGGIAADRPGPRGSIVAAANAGLVGFVRALALEIAPIRVNLISPGWVDTPVWDTISGGNKAALFEQMAGRLPVGRIGAPEDIAQAALYLMGNTFTTGETLHVDGGQRLI
ncbi:short chain dehydrogenase [Capsulimonas corticalis]|uniref:Short chain dehydrogenase n=1 Tax=Capsulimonas corticalis TaxID=2219043 RepID=A0A402D1P1_9BACT|nr:SDR family oxidoreductase [Capsulimonas corticalis]BDI28674.1 short chain dehydrogenase [Capsulimonas corticalis]